jgi:hypothetical protein
MGDHGLRARHDAAQHGDLALVHGPPAPIRDHVPIDIDGLAHRVCYQHWHQGLGGTDALELPQKLPQRCAVIATPQQGLERMLAGIEPGEAVEPQQGGKNQRLKAVHKRWLTMMQ